MLEQQVTLAAVAIALGGIAGIVLFVPFVIVRFRRRGTMALSTALMWAAALVYFWAIWTFTLLPLPDPNTITCAGTNLDPTTIISDVSEVIRESAGLKSLVAHPVLMEMALNVLLFVPLGIFTRILARRGILIALAAGLTVSVVVEFTQVTGVWGLYPCAYRVFDVKDMMTNTLGAGIGSVIALLLPQHLRTSTPVLAPQTPRPVTKGRRLLAMACDFLAFMIVSTAVAVTARAILAYGVGDEHLAFETNVTATLGAATSLVIWVMMTITTGKTLGDYAVRLVYRGSLLPTAIARAARVVGGIGLYGVLNLLPDPWNALTSIYIIIAVLFTIFTQDGRGLPGLLGRQELVDERADTPIS